MHITALVCVCVSRFPRCQTTGYYMPPAREIRSTKQTTRTPIRTQTQSEIHTHTCTHTYIHMHIYLAGREEGEEVKVQVPKGVWRQKIHVALNWNDFVCEI